METILNNLELERIKLEIQEHFNQLQINSKIEQPYFIKTTELK